MKPINKLLSEAETRCRQDMLKAKDPAKVVIYGLLAEMISAAQLFAEMHGV